MERVHGIEPRSIAWKATALPLCYTRTGTVSYSALLALTRGLSRKYPVANRDLAASIGCQIMVIPSLYRSISVDLNIQKKNGGGDIRTTHVRECLLKFIVN